VKILLANPEPSTHGPPTFDVPLDLHTLTKADCARAASTWRI
jgi:hypothetical protein